VNAVSELTVGCAAVWVWFAAGLCLAGFQGTQESRAVKAPAITAAWIMKDIIPKKVDLRFPNL
jgi:hypothetical protein